MRQASRAGYVTECLVDILYRAVIPFDRMTLPVPFPAPQMRQKLLRQTNGRLALFTFGRSWRATIKDATVEIDPAAALGRAKRRRTHCRRPGAGIHRDQNETGNVAATEAVCRHAFLNFPKTPSCPEQACYFVARSPNLLTRAPCRQNHVNNLGALALVEMVLDGSAQILQVAAGHRVG